jgi:hypothetical protein
MPLLYNLDSDVLSYSDISCSCSSKMGKNLQDKEGQRFLKLKLLKLLQYTSVLKKKNDNLIENKL